jgi:hypothetical protein
MCGFGTWNGAGARILDDLGGMMVAQAPGGKVKLFRGLDRELAVREASSFGISS